jgi:ankyrin repeat protein
MKDFNIEYFLMHEEFGLDESSGLVDIAIQQGNIELVRLLVEAGSNLGTVNVHYHTALLSAIDNRKIEIVRYLLGIGMNPNGESPQDRGWPLYFADGDEEIFQLLLDFGADRELMAEFPEPD